MPLVRVHNFGVSLDGFGTFGRAEIAAAGALVDYVELTQKGRLPRFLPPALPGWLYAPVKGASLLKTLLRARIIAAREAGVEEDAAELMERGKANGLELAGWPLSAEMIRQLEGSLPTKRPGLVAVDQETIGSGALWLRAEPDEDPAQADALAAVLAMALTA